MKSLKLQLVRQIMATDDPDVLETIRQILEMGGEMQPQSSPEFPPQDAIADALGLSSSANLDGEAQDLQQSIDEIFSPKGWMKSEIGSRNWESRVKRRQFSFPISHFPFSITLLLSLWYEDLDYNSPR